MSRTKPKEIKTTEPILPWHQQPGESDIAYNAFRVYLNLEKRTYVATAEALGASKALVNYYSPKYNWRERARHYDNWKATQYEENRINQVKRFQTTIVADETFDYDLILKEWREIFKSHSGDMSINELKQMISTRELIDGLGRRIAELPTTYAMSTLAAQKKLERPQNDDTYVLGWSDPHMEGGQIVDGVVEEVVMLGAGDEDRTTEASQEPTDNI